jgi:hypothetical protein
MQQHSRKEENREERDGDVKPPRDQEEDRLYLAVQTGLQDQERRQAAKQPHKAIQVSGHTRQAGWSTHCRLDDLGEIGYLQAGASDQRTVDFALAEVLRGIISIHRTAVQDTHSLGSGYAKKL